MENKILLKIALSLLIISITITILILAKVIFIPLFISFLFVYLLYPLVWQIEKHGVYRGAAIFFVLFVVFMVFAGAVFLIAVNLSNISVNEEVILEEVNSRTDAIMSTLKDNLGLNINTIDNFLKKTSISIATSLEAHISDFFQATTAFIFQITILPIFTFFLLFYRTKTAYFIFRLVGRQNKATALKVLKEISNVATRYITGQLLVILVLAILNTSGLYIIGVPNGVVFGTLAAFLNLIPYLGMFTGGLITILYVIFTVSDPLNIALQVLLMYMGVQFLENNLITPNIVGNNIKINPFAIIVGILIANLIWGIAGMLIAIPFLAILKIIMHSIDGLEPFAYLISDKGIENQKFKLGKIKNLMSKFKRS